MSPNATLLVSSHYREHKNDLMIFSLVHAPVQSTSPVHQSSPVIADYLATPYSLLQICHTVATKHVHSKVSAWGEKSDHT